MRFFPAYFWRYRVVVRRSISSKHFNGGCIPADPPLPHWEHSWGIGFLTLNGASPSGSAQLATKRLLQYACRVLLGYRQSFHSLCVTYITSLISHNLEWTFRKWGKFRWGRSKNWPTMTPRLIHRDRTFKNIFLTNHTIGGNLWPRIFLVPLVNLWTHVS